MIDGAPQIMHLAVDLYVDLVEVPAPVSNALHPADPLPTDVPCEHRAEPVPPEAHCLMAKIDAALEQQVLHVSKRQWEPHVHHDHKANDLRRRIETAERGNGFAWSRHPIVLNQQA